MSWLEHPHPLPKLGGSHPWREVGYRARVTLASKPQSAPPRSFRMSALCTKLDNPPSDFITRSLYSRKICLFHVPPAGHFLEIEISPQAKSGEDSDRFTRGCRATCPPNTNTHTLTPATHLPEIHTHRNKHTPTRPLCSDQSPRARKAHSPEPGKLKPVPHHRHFPTCRHPLCPQRGGWGCQVSSGYNTPAQLTQATCRYGAGAA